MKRRALFGKLMTVAAAVAVAPALEVRASEARLAEHGYLSDPVTGAITPATPADLELAMAERGYRTLAELTATWENEPAAKIPEERTAGASAADAYGFWGARTLAQIRAAAGCDHCDLQYLGAMQTAPIYLFRHMKYEAGRIVGGDIKIDAYVFGRGTVADMAAEVIRRMQGHHAAADA